MTGSFPGKVSVLVSDLSNNCLGRGYILAKALEPLCQVEIIGPLFGQSIWKPLENIGDEFELHTIHIQDRRKMLPVVRDVSDHVSGDVVYASKPLATSFGAALLARRRKQIPLMVDIDDWEIGWLRESLSNNTVPGALRHILRSVVRPFSRDSVIGMPVFGLATRVADEITVSGPVLQAKYGGEIVWHGRDTGNHRSCPDHRQQHREQKGIADSQFVVMFAGTPRSHKGLEMLVDAISLIESDDLVLWLVGIEEGDYGRIVRDYAAEKLGDNVVIDPIVPFEQLDEYLSAADLLVIPQLEKSASKGQVPAKLFDAMALGKPIVVSDAWDLPEIVGDAGLVFEAGDTEGLCDAISRIANDPELRRSLGANGRALAESKYSVDAMTSTLAGILERVVVS